MKCIVLTLIMVMTKFKSSSQTAEEPHFRKFTFLYLVANLAPYDKSLVAKWHL